MGDVGDTLRAYRDHSWSKRQRNKESSTEILTRAGVNFTTKNEGVHLIVEEGGKVVDYWPSTGLFIDRADRKRRRGVFRLLKHVGKKAESRD